MTWCLVKMVSLRNCLSSCERHDLLLPLCYICKVNHLQSRDRQDATIRSWQSLNAFKGWFLFIFHPLLFSFSWSCSSTPSDASVWVIFVPSYIDVIVLTLFFSFQSVSNPHCLQGTLLSEFEFRCWLPAICVIFISYEVKTSSTNWPSAVLNSLTTARGCGLS